MSKHMLSKEHLLKLIAENKARTEAARQAAVQAAVQAANQSAQVPAATPVPAPIPAAVQEAVAPVVHSSVPELIQAVVDAQPIAAGTVVWNEQQKQAHQLGLAGKSFCLIGAAGTGKTTTLKELVRLLIAEGKVPQLAVNTKHLRKGAPGIALISFTRRAVRNIRKVMSADVSDNCVTHHKLVEYAPVFYEVFDEESQEMKKTMRFEPTRTAKNTLPASLRVVIVDESSMYSADLEMELLRALPDPENVQFIFLGDLHQLPPVYGTAVLGFKLKDLPVVELTQIYRQAQESPIIALAHKIKNGETIPVGNEQIVMESPQGKVTIHPWKKPLDDWNAAHAMSKFLKNLSMSPDYNEEEDIILCPQEKVKNRAFGTNEFNRVIAQQLGEKRNAEVFEIIAGFNKHYYAVGDRVLVEREDAVIVDIKRNARYFGKRPHPSSTKLDRWGALLGTEEKKRSPLDDDDDIDAILDAVQITGDDKEDRKTDASHTIDVQLLDSGETITISSAGDVNAMQFAYCLTVHKSQGSEWRRVFFITHQSHVTMWSRELLYTAVTRAREELYMIVEPDRPRAPGTLTKAARAPRIKGDTLAEKAEHFAGKRDDYERRKREIFDYKRTNAAPLEVDVTPPAISRAAAYLPETPAAPARPFIKVESLINDAFRARCRQFFLQTWQQAALIYGTSIGLPPVIAMDMQTKSTLGKAYLNAGKIRLSSWWMFAAQLDVESSNPRGLWEAVVEDTIIHEVAHMVAFRFAGDTGHNTGWVTAIKLLGRNPDQFYQGPGLPPMQDLHRTMLGIAETWVSRDSDTSDDAIDTSRDTE